MRIAVCDALSGVPGFRRLIVDSLAGAHEIASLPHQYTYAASDARKMMAEHLVRACDLIIGTVYLSEVAIDLLAARERTGCNVPYLSWMDATLARGGFHLAPLLAYLTTNDSLLVSCAADAHLASSLLSNVTLHLLPPAFDDESFFPLDSSRRAALRATHGFKATDKILIYTGRSAVSRNIHAMLRVFKALVDHVPGLHLIIACGAQNEGGMLAEHGVIPVQFAKTVSRLAATLSLPEGRLHWTPAVPGSTLCDLCNIADLQIDLMTYPDDRLSISVVEAMACGTPAVVSSWGPLKGMAVEGRSGSRVSVTVNSTGVKANWWEAVNKIALLLMSPGASQTLRESCVQYANEQYSPAAFARRLKAIVSCTARDCVPGAVPLRPTAFADAYWAACQPQKHGVLYRQEDRSFEMFTDFLRPYCGLEPESLDFHEALCEEDVLCLPWPIECESDGTFRVNDPHHPFAIVVPRQHEETFKSAVSVLRRRPLLTVGELKRCLPPHPGMADGLAWMVSDVLLRSRCPSHWILPREVDERLGLPLFRVQAAHRHTDFLILP